MWKRIKKLFSRSKGGEFDDDIDPHIEGDFEDDRGWLDKLRDGLKKASQTGAEKVRGSARRNGTGSFKIENLGLTKLTEHATWIRWALVVLALFLLSEAVARYIGVLVRPNVTPLRRSKPVATRKQPTEDYDTILRRNMFNVEGKIPDPFDQGMLDCFSQAVKSSKPINLLGTIVMKNDAFSVALIQEGGNAEPLAVKKDEEFLQKYIALKVDRQRLCFQVKSTQDLEYVEVKDDTPTMSIATEAPRRAGGIQMTGDNKFKIKRNFLDDKLSNLNEILQSARAVPYIDGSGNFKGFLIQSIQQDSIFYELGVRQGDVLNGVNDIQLDNAGKGLEAFQRLRNSSNVTLEITRGGEKKSLNYQVQ